MYCLGIDLGGTNIAAGAVAPDGRILARASCPTGAGRSFSDIVRDMAACAVNAAEQAGIPASEIASVGVGVPGYADPVSGVVTRCNNLGWTSVPLREELRRQLASSSFFSGRTPVVFTANDADCAVLAEYKAGAAVGAHSCVRLTLGTGLGGGILLDGKLWSGAHRAAGEIGHMTRVPDGRPCTCGRRGCVERYCSATALLLGVREAAPAFKDSILARAPGEISAKQVMDAARAGDPLAVYVFDDFTVHLARTIDNVIHLLDPEVVLLGGGVSRAGSFLLNAILAAIPSQEMGIPRLLPVIALASLGNDAGIIGAALLE